MNIEWEDGFTIKVKVEENTVVISANKEGLLSLARHLTECLPQPLIVHNALSLTLTLFVLRILTNDHDSPFSLDDLAFFADRFDR
jgi:hypothetical protein